jgi:SPP1 family holin
MKIKTETIIRTVTLGVALLNQLLVTIGKNPLPFVPEELAEFIAYALTLGASAWAWWKNNSWTKNAIKADEVLEELKNGGGQNG